MINEFETYELSNGIKVVHLPAISKVAHLGLIIDAGTRDEDDNKDGLAHFIEHAIFKGTGKRKSFHVLSALDRVGGELNAYTAKEDTCYHASFLKQYFSRAADIISDIAFNASFPEKEIEKEKGVIIEEIESYNDSPSELIFDRFEELIFEGHPLGKNILGTADSVLSLSAEDARKFLDKNYGVNRMVICTAGDLNLKKTKNILEKFFGNHKVKTEERKANPLNITYNTFTQEEKRETYQSHIILGGRAYHLNDKKKAAISLLNNYLGGAGLNSLFNLDLREKNALVYHVESNYTGYTDAGLWQVYLGCEKSQKEKALKLVSQILKKVKTKKLGILQLHLAKKQFIGHMALAQENTLNSMMALAKSYIVYGKLDSDDSSVKKINPITDSDILEVANEKLDEKNLSTLIYH